MKKSIILALMAALVFSACAKEPQTGENDAEKKHFDSWAHINYPDAVKTRLGSYIIETQDGNGKAIDGAGYILFDYTVRGLDGVISSTTSADVAKQLGTYSPANYYGPMVQDCSEGNMFVGILELLEGKHVGLRTKAAIPGWLFSTEKRNRPEDYLSNTGVTSAIYDFRVVDAFNDVKDWELDSLTRYIRRNYPKISPADSLKNGFYYIKTKESSRPDSTFSKDAKAHVNYIGRLLNGKVFDTNVADTAKYYGIYKAGYSYGPTLINWGETYEALTMTSSASSMIDGFKYALFRMHPYEKGRAIFYSGYGYGSSGSGETIPAYSPLIFDFELVDSK